MSKPLALLFAAVSVLLLCLVSVAFSTGSAWLVVLSILAALLFIGFGFVVKSKLRKRSG